MGHRAGVEFHSHTGIARGHQVFAIVVEAISRGRTNRQTQRLTIGRAYHGRIGQAVVLFAVAKTSGDPRAHVVGEVVLAARHTEEIFFPAEGPVLRKVLGGVGRARNHIGWRDAGARGIDVVILIAHVRRQPRTGAAIVHAKREHGQLSFLTIDRRFAIASNGVGAYAEAVICTEAAREVG